MSCLENITNNWLCVFFSLRRATRFDNLSTVAGVFAVLFQKRVGGSLSSQVELRLEKGTDETFQYKSRLLCGRELTSSEGIPSSFTIPPLRGLPYTLFFVFGMTSSLSVPFSYLYEVPSP